MGVSEAFGTPSALAPSAVLNHWTPLLHHVSHVVIILLIRYF